MLCPNCGKNTEESLTYCTHCASRMPRITEAEELPAIPPMETESPRRPNNVGPRVLGMIGVLFALILFTSAFMSRALGSAMAQSAPIASLALLAGYFLHSKSRRQSLSNAGHIATFAGFIILSTILHEVIIHVGQSASSERSGIFLGVEILAAYAVYYFVLRKA